MRAFSTLELLVVVAMISLLISMTIYFRWDDTKSIDGLVVLELNTQPGMTTTSLVPEQAMACGISFQNLCKWIIEDASCLR